MHAVKTPYATIHLETTPVPAPKASLEIPSTVVSTSMNVNSRVFVDPAPSVEMLLAVGSVIAHQVMKGILIPQDAEIWTNAQEITHAVEKPSAPIWRAALSVLALQGSLETP